MDVHALKEREWSITAIANHPSSDRTTIRAHLNEEDTRCSGSLGTRPLEPPVPYLTPRLLDDPHVWASALFDEVMALGYSLNYPSFARQVRLASLRPHCGACAGVKGRDTVEIFHPPGEEIQWDWFERRRTPWGALSTCCSARARTRGGCAVICESIDQAHLIDAMDRVMRRLGGTTRDWRVDGLAVALAQRRQGPRREVIKDGPLFTHLLVPIEATPASTRSTNVIATAGVLSTLSGKARTPGNQLTRRLASDSRIAGRVDESAFRPNNAAVLARRPVAGQLDLSDHLHRAVGGLGRGPSRARQHRAGGVGVERVARGR